MPVDPVGCEAHPGPLGFAHLPGSLPLLGAVAMPCPHHLPTCDEASTQLSPDLALFLFSTWKTN